MTSVHLKLFLLKYILLIYSNMIKTLRICIICKIKRTNNHTLIFKITNIE